mgnify:CR=1 FL=1
MAERILLVEDEEKLARMVELELRYEGYEVEKAFDGRTGLERALSGSFDLVLLDIMLPQLSGMEVLRRLRQEGNSIPVLMLTAKGEVEDKVLGLDEGADDYVAKPFGMMELMARIRAALRHGGQREPQSRTYSLGTLFVDPARHIVRDGEREVTLTLKEFQVLCLLMERAGTVFTRDQLLNTIWGYEFDGASRTVDVHIRTLRQKLGRSGDCIETVRGVGYKVSTDTRTESVRGE